MRTEFNGKIYEHETIAERQREVAVSLTALHMMQEHHGNRFFSFKCVSRAEESEWYEKAERLVPAVSSTVPNTTVSIEGGAPLMRATANTVAVLQRRVCAAGPVSNPVRTNGN
jgi:hypothetical protein